MNKKSIENERGKVYYWIRNKGRGKCIFLCHGLTADHNLFKKQMEYFPDDYTLIAWDMPLHGKSLNYKDFSLTNAAKDIKMILDNENITHTSIAGQSAGGYVAQRFANMFPHTCDAFIGIDTSPLSKEYYSFLDLFVTRYYSFFAGMYPYKIYCREAAKVAAYTKEAYESFYETLVRLGKKDMKKACNAVYREIPKYTDTDLSCPVLLFRKYNDMWRIKKGYKLINLKNASHNANFDNYRDFNNEVYNFLKENRI